MISCITISVKRYFKIFEIANKAAMPGIPKTPDTPTVIGLIPTYIL